MSVMHNIISLNNHDDGGWSKKHLIKKKIITNIIYIVTPINIYIYIMNDNHLLSLPEQ